MVNVDGPPVFKFYSQNWLTLFREPYQCTWSYFDDPFLSLSLKVSWYSNRAVQQLISATIDHSGACSDQSLAFFRTRSNRWAGIRNRRRWERLRLEPRGWSWWRWFLFQRFDHPCAVATAQLVEWSLLQNIEIRGSNPSIDIFHGL